MTLVSTKTLFGNLINNTARLQKSAADVNLQISTGLKSTDYKGVSTDSERLINLESDLKRLDAQNRNIATMNNKVQSQYSAMNSLIDIATQIKVDMTRSQGSLFVNDTELANLVTGAQEDFSSLLNTKIAGEYIFGGTATNIPPVDLTDAGIVAQTSPSAADTAYYQGNNNSVRVQIADGVTINPNISGGEDGFEKTLRAFNLILNNPGDNTANTEALNLLDEAIADMSNLRSRVSSNAATLDKQLEINENEGAILADLISDINAVDIAEATLQSQQLNNQLEASFAISARALSLNLYDFLR